MAVAAELVGLQRQVVSEAQVVLEALAKMVETVVADQGTVHLWGHSTLEMREHLAQLLPPGDPIPSVVVEVVVSVLRLITIQTLQWVGSEVHPEEAKELPVEQAVAVKAQTTDWHLTAPL
jgi:hypothetical protein